MTLLNPETYSCQHKWLRLVDDGDDEESLGLTRYFCLLCDAIQVEFPELVIKRPSAFRYIEGIQ